MQKVALIPFFGSMRHTVLAFSQALCSLHHSSTHWQQANASKTSCCHFDFQSVAAVMHVALMHRNGQQWLESFQEV